jgi:GDP-mannose 6-dehydrogenase
MQISIFGLGYVGAVSLACLARDGHQVIGVDTEPSKLNLIRTGRPPLVEEGIHDLFRNVCASGRVRVTADPLEAVAQSEISFVCVGTPSQPNGSQDLTAVQRLSQQLGDALRHKQGYHVVVVRSTVQPGTVEKVIQPILEHRSGKSASSDFGLCFQPEFLREGSSIRDYDDPPFTIVGATSERAALPLRDLFGRLPCEFIVTHIRTAEALKMACNAFHALKITFANEIGRLGQAAGIDARAVMDLLSKDTRLNISPAYLKPGFAFGGSCLPKELRAILHLAKQVDVELPMLGSVLFSNKIHIDHAFSIIASGGRRKVGMIGLSFKSGTDDLRESPLVTLAELLIGRGYPLQIYDPDVNAASLIGANKRYIEQTIPHFSSLMRGCVEDVVDASEVIVVSRRSAEVMNALRQCLKADHRVIDLVGLEHRVGLGDYYEGVCW